MTDLTNAAELASSRATESEGLGRLADDVVQSLRDASAFRVWVPEELGGVGGSIHDGLDAFFLRPPTDEGGVDGAGLGGGASVCFGSGQWRDVCFLSLLAAGQIEELAEELVDEVRGSPRFEITTLLACLAPAAGLAAEGFASMLIT